MPGQNTYLFSTRFMVTIMCFWAVSNMMYLRINMSVAIVCMVNESQTDPHIEDSNSSTGRYSNGTIHELPAGDMVPVSDNGGGSLKWDTLTQGQVLGAYYYGYFAAKLPTGWAVQFVGGRNLILTSSLVASILCLVTPIVALNSAVATIVLRVILGICGGMVSPSIQSILGNWSPLSERSRMGAYTFAGLPCGTLAAFIFSGLLCQFGFAGGWPSVFYTFGMCSLAFSLLWFVAVSETPHTHRCIRLPEKEYIQNGLKKTTSEQKRQAVPWRSILTSPPVYAVLACGVSTDFVGNVFLLYLPTYLADVMNFNIASSGLLSALPYVFCFLTLTLGGHVSDYLIKHTKLKTGTVRKLTSGSGMLACIASLICISFLGSDQPEVAVALLVLSVAGIGLLTIGYFVNPLDIAPEHAGIIVAIASTAGDVAGFISPAVVSAITSQGTVQQSWQIVFLMSAGVVCVCLIYYLIFASGDVQPWAQSLQVGRELNLEKHEPVSSSKHSNNRDEQSQESSQERLLQRQPSC